jgi:hypothetical protein
MKLSTTRGRSEKTPRFFVVCLLIFVFYWLCKQINTFYVPDSDFFNYLFVGQRMLANPLDRVITSAPLYPVIIYIFQRTLPVRHPGITGGIILNITCFTISLYFLWRLLKQWIGWYALLPVLLFVVNPLVLYVVLQPTNLPLATVLVLIALYYFEKHPAASYLLALFALATRAESVVVFFVFIIKDLVARRAIRCPAWLFILFVVAFFWYARPLMPKDNIYSETIARRQEIPNATFLRNSFINAPFSYELLAAYDPSKIFSKEGVMTVFSVVWIVIGALYYFNQKRLEALPFLGYIVGYCVIHVLFPDRVLRYSYPMLPFVYTLMFWPVVVVRNAASYIKKALCLFIIFGITLIIIAGSLINGPPYINNQKWDRAERRLTVEWLNQNVKKPTAVYAFEYYVFNYYVENDKVTFAETKKPDVWIHDLCAYNQNVYIVFDNETEGPGSYYDHLNGLDYFLAINKSEEAKKSLLLIKSIEVNSRWAKIYKFSKPSNDWCKRFVL